MASNRTQCFERLYAEHATMVRQLCLGYMRGRGAEADDISQEVFTQVWRYLDQFRQEASAKTWIYRVTVNACLAYTRKLKRRREDNLAVPEQLPDAASTSASSNPQLERLYAAIGTLPEIDRLIYMLTLEGQTNAQIAEVTGLSPSALRVRNHRSKQTLRKLLTHAN